MLRSLSVTIRTFAIFAFLLAMPLLAYPPVTNWLERILADVPAGLEAAWASCQTLGGVGAAPNGRPSGATLAHRQPARPAQRPAPVREPSLQFAPESWPTPGAETATRARASDPAVFRQISNTPASQENGPALRHRLEQLGAEKMVFESVDAGGCRFRCEVPLADNSVYRKPFEAIGDDPLQAMQRVESAVMSWHGISPGDAAVGDVGQVFNLSRDK
jgi:hypothetical protein